MIPAAVSCGRTAEANLYGSWRAHWARMTALKVAIWPETDGNPFRFEYHKIGINGIYMVR